MRNSRKVQYFVGVGAVDVTVFLMTAVVGVDAVATMFIVTGAVGVL